MGVFLTLLQKIFPLYLLILLGFLAGKKLPIQRETIGLLLLYLVSPIVFFYSTSQLPFEPRLLLIPILVYATACITSVLVYRIGSRVWQRGGALKNIAAFSAGTGNTGYFGIPVILMLFGETAVGYAVLFIIGTVLFENTLGFYFVARGGFSPRDSLRKLVRLPTLYAFALGLFVCSQSWQFPAEVTNVFLSVRGAYSFLGMLLIGLALSQGKFESDWHFLWLSFAAKFLVWPIFIGAVVWADFSFFHVFHATVYRVLLVLACVPLAANTVVMATLLRCHPEIVSFSVLVSTLVALVTIPLCVSVILSLPF